ncbi:S9 family peptidase [Luteococcus japonicus]|uniref:Prolyl oligopeptidase family protein n=1 Tax=Luteococcus japonicus LSP_Lj1 TaxID=1255658 RepID=A0A1R4K611_9ACTN|nr:prolyl oligopeptidase family serine peptidase [Luteococcus japonicus]SJN39737.1 prolyl oligopeptidase family protein [Luteococcus japonicus LSP_Lj1]
MTTTECTPLPCGSWPSVVDVDALLKAGTGLSSVGVDGDDVYWLESRPELDGRTVLVRLRDGRATDATPTDASVRSRVQEYGGGTWHARDGIVAWCNDSDGAVHVIEDGADRAITGTNRDLRFAGLRVDAARRLVLSVREDHRRADEAVTTVVALDLDGDNGDGGRVLAEGSDFYAHPELSDGGRLAWVEWSHPNMPWDGSRIMVLDLAEDGTGELRQVAGGDEISVLHPRWAGEDLVFMSDETGFWNPWILRGDDTRQQLLSSDKDFCRPLWVLPNDLYAAHGRTLVTFCYDDARARVCLLDLDGGEPRWVEGTFADVDSIAAGPAGIFLNVDHADRHAQILRLDPSTMQTTVVQEAASSQPAPEWVSRPESVWFEGRHGRSQAWYYPPANPQACLPEGELAPMIVNTHGGPTGMAPGIYRTDFQFWTSRGFAVLDVNYSGSAGFGRAYRNRLYGTWGIADVDDCVDAVQAIVERRLADPRRIVIQGGSAGGYTTLRALVVSDVFAAGVSRYGIGDLETLVTDTHKFESRYPFLLVAPYPEGRQVYLDRSPIHHVDRLSSPMLILQGLDDKVVPPNQAESMAQAVRAKKLPVALILFEGEGHGFRKQSTRRAVVEAQLSFFSQLFGFTPADEVPRLEVENLA